MLKVKEAIIVEGKYDKIKLSSLIDGLIIETNGFRIFKDNDKMQMLRRLAESRGLLILTDSDAAGFQIRNYLNGAIDNRNIKHAYIPDIYGKERRKEKPSKEGKLGVEGISQEILAKAIRAAGASCAAVLEPSRQITKMDLFEDGFSGRPDSAARRKALLHTLSLPEHLSVNALVKVLNSIMSFEDYKSVVGKLNDTV